MSKINLAIVGATGAVGREMLKTVEARKIPVNRLRLFASHRSVGMKLPYQGKDIEVEELSETSFERQDIDFALFSAGGSISSKFAPIAANNNCAVIDNSSAWRMKDDVPLVVPEVNPHDLRTHKGIIANPNCSTIQMVVVLKPIYDISPIQRVVVSTYQSVSGAGMRAMAELRSQTEAFLAEKEVETEKFPYQIAFNCIPHIDVFLENGYTKEEEKMVNETKKIMGDDTIGISATCVRVPVFVGHAESVNIQTKDAISVKKVRNVLQSAAGVKVIDNPDKNLYPLQIECAGLDDTFVGRIREDNTINNGLNCWIVSDNLKKGAALNAVQILELLINKKY